MNINKATDLLNEAYLSLKEQGLSEKFFPLAVNVGQEQWGVFFGHFGSDSGLSIDIYKTDTPGEMAICVSIRRYRQPMWIRIKEILREIWNVFRGHSSEYVIHLADDDVTKLKDMLRNLQ